MVHDVLSLSTTLFTISKKCPLIDRPKNGRKMVNRRQRGEIRKSGDKGITRIWSDYRRINIMVVIEMGYFLTLTVHEIEIG